MRRAAFAALAAAALITAIVLARADVPPFPTWFYVFAWYPALALLDCGPFLLQSIVPLPTGLRFGSARGCFGMGGPGCLPEARPGGAKQGHRHHCRGRQSRPVPSHKFFQLITQRRRNRADRFLPEIILEILRQRGCGFVAPAPILLQCLHHDPIQFPAHQPAQLLRLHSAAGGQLRQLLPR